MLRMAGREEQKPGRTPHCTGNHYSKAKFTQLGACSSIVTSRKTLRGKNKASPYHVGWHHEGTPNQDIVGRNHSSLHISKKCGKEYASEQRHLAHGEQLLQQR